MISVLCPTCRDRKVPRVEPTFPFCSPACRDRDLLGWTEERFRIEGPPATPEELANEREAADEENRD